MGKQMFNRTKKILGILRVVFFVASVTVVTVSAYPGHDRGWYRNNGYHWYHNGGTMTCGTVIACMTMTTGITTTTTTGGKASGRMIIIGKDSL